MKLVWSGQRWEDLEDSGQKVQHFIQIGGKSHSENAAKFLNAHWKEINELSKRSSAILTIS